jgi:hypothetical protein
MYIKNENYIKKCFTRFFIVFNLSLKTLLSKISSKHFLKIYNSHAHAHVKKITKALQDCPSWFPTPSQLFKKYLRIATIIMSKIVPKSSTNCYQPWGCIHAPPVLPFKNCLKIPPITIFQIPSKTSLNCHMFRCCLHTPSPRQSFFYYKSFQKWHLLLRTHIVI